MSSKTCIFSKGIYSSFDIMLHSQGLPNVNQHLKACPSSFRASAEAATTCNTTSQAQAFGACLALVDLDADRFSPLPSRAGPCLEEWFGGGDCKRVCHVRGSHFGWFYRGNRLPYFETNPTGKSTLDPGETSGGLWVCAKRRTEHGRPPPDCFAST